VGCACRVLARVPPTAPKSCRCRAVLPKNDRWIEPRTARDFSRSAMLQHQPAIGAPRGAPCWRGTQQQLGELVKGCGKAAPARAQLVRDLRRWQGKDFPQYWTILDIAQMRLGERKFLEAHPSDHSVRVPRAFCVGQSSELRLDPDREGRYQ